MTETKDNNNNSANIGVSRADGGSGGDKVVFVEGGGSGQGVRLMYMMYTTPDVFRWVSNVAHLLHVQSACLDLNYVIDYTTPVTAFMSFWMDGPVIEWFILCVILQD